MNISIYQRRNSTDISANKEMLQVNQSEERQVNVQNNPPLRRSTRVRTTKTRPDYVNPFSSGKHQKLNSIPARGKRVMSTRSMKAKRTVALRASDANRKMWMFMEDVELPLNKRRILSGFQRLFMLCWIFLVQGVGDLSPSICALTLPLIRSFHSAILILPGTKECE